MSLRTGENQVPGSFWNLIFHIVRYKFSLVLSQRSLLAIHNQCVSALQLTIGLVSLKGGLYAY